MAKKRKSSKDKDCVDNDPRFYRSNFDYLYKREMINQRAYLYFQIIEKARQKGDPYLVNKGISVSDLCLALYQSIKILDFFSHYSEEILGKTVNDIDKMVEDWLKEKHFIWWLLTKEAVDDLLENKSIKYNDEGFLELINNKI
jgi:hypothetical protein